MDNLLDEAIGDAMAESIPDKPEILVVDDEASVCDTLGIVLSDVYSVQVATSGNEGIAKLHCRTMAVVLDVRMRHKDGFDTFVEMKKKCPDVPILFHSAYQDVRDPYDVMNELRPFAYIKKGDDAALRQTIAEAVASYAEMLAAEDLAHRLEDENARLAALESERSRELDELSEELSSSQVPASTREP